MNNMDVNRFRQDEHEEYFFGYSSTEIYSTLVESITKCIQSFMNECRNAVIAENEEKDRNKIEKQIEDLEALYLDKSMKILEEFKNVLRNIFHIPPNVPIYGIKNKNDSFNAEQIENLRKEVADLEQTYLRERRFYEILKLENELVNKLKPTILETKSILAMMEDEEELKTAERLKILADRLEAKQSVNVMSSHYCSEQEDFDL